MLTRYLDRSHPLRRCLDPHRLPPEKECAVLVDLGISPGSLLFRCHRSEATGSIPSRTSKATWRFTAYITITPQLPRARQTISLRVLGPPHRTSLHRAPNYNLPASSSPLPRRCSCRIAFVLVSLEFSLTTPTHLSPRIFSGVYRVDLIGLSINPKTRRAEFESLHFHCEVRSHAPPFDVLLEAAHVLARSSQSFAIPQLVPAPHWDLQHPSPPRSQTAAGPNDDALRSATTGTACTRRYLFTTLMPIALAHFARLSREVELGMGMGMETERCTQMVDWDMEVENEMKMEMGTAHSWISYRYRPACEREREREREVETPPPLPQVLLDESCACAWRWAWPYVLPIALALALGPVLPVVQAASFGFISKTPRTAGARVQCNGSQGGHVYARKEHEHPSSLMRAQSPSSTRVGVLAGAVFAQPPLYAYVHTKPRNGEAGMWSFHLQGPVPKLAMPILPHLSSSLSIALMFASYPDTYPPPHPALWYPFPGLLIYTLPRPRPRPIREHDRRGWIM
ncbi:hypothetical protein B0H13DRAFT_2388964 [Mycena leptocephala]|nr:hypothetical protein B0H13DRAFT_2388964 [Mycena leptocephala]